MSDFESNILCTFSVEVSDPIKNTTKPPVIAIPRSFPVPIEDVKESAKDHFSAHYTDCFHDFTLKALRQIPQSSRPPLNYYDIVTDRNCLRKLMTNSCLEEAENAVLCKRQAMVIMAENVNGTLFLAHRERYESTPLGLHGGFKRIVANLSEDVTMYRLNTVKFNGVKLLLRHELEAVEQSSDPFTATGVKIKCKLNHPKKGLGLSVDFFRNVWIQMVLGNLQKLYLGIHQYGKLKETRTYTLAEVQQQADVSEETWSECVRRLSEILTDLQLRVGENRQALIHFNEDGLYDVQLQNEGSYDLPLLSKDTRSQLLES